MILCDMVTRVLLMSHRMGQVPVSNRMGQRQYPNLKTGMDWWMVSASLVLQEDIITFHRQFNDADEAISAEVARVGHCCTGILCNISWVDADQITHNWVLQRWSLKLFRHDYSCEFTVFIVAFKDQTGRQYARKLKSRGSHIHEILFNEIARLRTQNNLQIFSHQRQHGIIR